MNLRTAIRVALGSIYSKKGQSVLTCLGMVIGISSVIAVMVLGAGARGKLDASLETIGKNLILVRPGSRSGQGNLCDLAPLTMGDVEAIARGAGTWIVGVAPSQMTQRMASSAHGDCMTWLAGSLPAMRQIRNWQVTSGRYYDDNDVRQASPVCLLGQTTRRRLFPEQTNPVGEWIRVGQVRLRVIGILGAKGRAPTGGDQDDQVSVPITTLQRRLGAAERMSMILATAKSDDLLDRAKDEITRVMKQRHHHAPQLPDDFDVSTVREIAELAETFTRIMQRVVVVIASISLVIGGIGIMNIMLASVTQRTREIGIRIAIGARPADIRMQFLTEAVVLAMLGGSAGIALGMGGAVALARLAGWPVIISPAGVATTYLVSAGIGILFGYYPASKAARLEPIRAIRCE
jgi:putative ABC transport system permease protein